MEEVVVVFCSLSYLFFISVASASDLGGLGGCSSSCGELQDIRYPFHLQGGPPHCGDEKNYELVCQGNKTVLEILSDRYFVTNIFYETSTIRIVGAELASGNCSLPFRSLSISFIPKNFRNPGLQYWAAFVNCSKKIESSLYRSIPCLSQHNRFVYVTQEYFVENLLPSCSYISMVPIAADVNITIVEDVIQVLREGFSLSWGVKNYTRSMIIHRCLKRARWDAREEMREAHHKLKWLLYPFQLEYSFHNCIKNTRYFYDGAYALDRLVLVLIVLLDIAVFLMVFATLGRCIFAPLSILVFLAYQHRKMFAPIDVVEEFLRGQETIMPRRYAYTDIVAMTRHFKEKLGQGGYGAVFKGELRGGHLVAVKMLGNPRCDGEEFINEVSTIGRIHHVNVVRLVGFCSEGSNRALVYEFMWNGSLDKHIFSSNGANRRFTVEKLKEIAVSVARGIDYLHRGCDMRILHFDIKPHNILLDQNFNPKISDFGLAKLYPKDYSLVSALAARGTVGYMAPELISRSFGLVSYKSDVYSFGMLLLEMSGGRRNADLRVENSSQEYYPSWIYDRLEQRGRLEFSNGIEIDDVETMLCKVGLWCIQMRPSERPSMSKVIEMLEGNTDTIALPPKPFLFSSSLSSRMQSTWDSSLTVVPTVYEHE